MGPVGPQGIQGEQGLTGTTGDKGDRGATGPRGPQGETGPVGPQGERGATGARGPQGEAGPVGPQGERGATGARGPQGETGPVGPQGDPGTANVIYSPWTDLSFINAGGKSMAIWNVPAITPAIMNNGYVGVYWKSSTGAVSMLPVIAYTGDPAQKLIFVLSAAGGQIILEQTGMGSYVNTATDRFRYVLIPGGTPVAGVGRAADIDWSRASYAQVKQMLRLPD